MDTVIYDDNSFIKTAKTFYDNGECNSIEEFEQDLTKILLISNLFRRYEVYGETNFSLLLNHFISFVNCFGIISEALLMYKIPEHEEKINSLFILIGHKNFDGLQTIDEKFFIDLKRGIK